MYKVRNQDTNQKQTNKKNNLSKKAQNDTNKVTIIEVNVRNDVGTERAIKQTSPSRQK